MQRFNDCLNPEVTGGLQLYKRFQLQCFKNLRSGCLQEVIIQGGLKVTIQYYYIVNNDRMAVTNLF